MAGSTFSTVSPGKQDDPSHSTSDNDRATQWPCLFCSGLLRSQLFDSDEPFQEQPTFPSPIGATNCSNGTLTVQAAETEWWQRITFGATRSPSP